MTATFTTVADRARDTLRVTMSGFFRQEDVEAFVRDLSAKLERLRSKPNQHLMLCDVRHMKIQSQEIVAMFSSVVGAPQFRSKRLAFVTGSSLSRLQAKRLTTRDGVSYFSDIAAAEKWLAEADTAPSAFPPPINSTQRESRPVG